MDITDVTKAATEKFGDVITVIRKDATEYFVACKRAEPPLPERPYMTITAGFSNANNANGVRFYWGHYDLTLDELHVAIAGAHAAIAKAKQQ